MAMMPGAALCEAGHRLRSAATGHTAGWKSSPGRSRAKGKKPKFVRGCFEQRALAGDFDFFLNTLMMATTYAAVSANFSKSTLKCTSSFLSALWKTTRLRCRTAWRLRK